MFRGKQRVPQVDLKEWQQNPDESLVRLISKNKKVPSVLGLLGIFLDRLDASLILETPPENRDRTLEIVKKISVIDLYFGRKNGVGLEQATNMKYRRGNYPITEAPDGVWSYSANYLDVIVEMLDLATQPQNSISHRWQYDEEGSYATDAIVDASMHALVSTIFTHHVIASFLHGNGGPRESKFGSQQVLDLTKQVMERAIPAMSRGPVYVNSNNFVLPYLPPSLVANLL